MSGVIPVDEDEEQEVYDDVGQLDEDIYEELPGPIPHSVTIYTHEELSYVFHTKHALFFTFIF